MSLPSILFYVSPRVFNPETVVCSLQGKWERRPLATVVRVTPPSSLELSSRPSAVKPKRRVFPQGEVLFSNVTQRHLTGLGPYRLESTAAALGRCTPVMPCPASFHGTLETVQVSLARCQHDSDCDPPSNLHCIPLSLTKH